MRIIAPRLRGGWPESYTEDVVQDALVDIIRAHADCQAESEGETVAWVVAIGRRRVATLYRREAHRRRKRSALAPTENIADSGVGALSPGLQRVVGSLSDPLSELSEQQHRLLWERILGGATWAEVGEALHIPHTAAKRRWQRLVVRLRASFPLYPD